MSNEATPWVLAKASKELKKLQDLYSENKLTDNEYLAAALGLLNEGKDPAMQELAREIDAATRGDKKKGPR